MARNPKLSTIFSAADRLHVYNLAQGITSETIDRRGGMASVTPTASGQIRLNAMPVLEGDHIDTLSMYMTSTAPVGQTLTRFGIYDAGGRLLAQTADLTASLAANTWINGALTTPLDFTTPQVVYAGLINVYSTSAGSWQGAAYAGTASWLTLPTGWRSSYLITGQADLTATVTLSSANAGSQNYYVAAW